MLNYKLSLKNVITPSIPIAILLTIGCIAFWFLADLGSHLSNVNESVNPFVKSIQLDVLNNMLSFSTITLLFTVLNAFLLAQLNSQYTLIRTRTFLPIIIFMILMSVWTETHLLNESHLALTLFIIALFYFFNMQKDVNGVEQAFMGSLAIGIASLLINPLIFLMPFCWIGFLMFQSFSLRTFLASLFGILSPWLIYVSVCAYLHPNFNPIEVLNAESVLGIDLMTIPILNIAYIVAVSVVLFLGLIGLFSNAHGDAIQTRTRLNFLILILFAFSILSIVYAQEIQLFLPMLAILYSLLVSHAFTLKENNFYAILFIVFCILNIAFIISKLFAL